MFFGPCLRHPSRAEMDQIGDRHAHTMLTFALAIAPREIQSLLDLGMQQSWITPKAKIASLITTSSPLQCTGKCSSATDNFQLKYVSQNCWRPRNLERARPAFVQTNSQISHVKFGHVLGSTSYAAMDP